MINLLSDELARRVVKVNVNVIDGTVKTLIAFVKNIHCLSCGVNN